MPRSGPTAADRYVRFRGRVVSIRPIRVVSIRPIRVVSGPAPRPSGSFRREHHGSIRPSRISDPHDATDRARLGPRPLPASDRAVSWCGVRARLSTPRVSTPRVSTPRVSTPSVSTPRVSTPRPPPAQELHAGQFSELAGPRAAVSPPRRRRDSAPAADTALPLRHRAARGRGVDCRPRCVASTPAHSSATGGSDSGHCSQSHAAGRLRARLRPTPHRGERGLLRGRPRCRRGTGPVLSRRDARQWGGVGSAPVCMCVGPGAG